MNNNIISKINDGKIKSYMQLLEEISNEEKRKIREYYAKPITFTESENIRHIDSLTHQYDSVKITNEIIIVENKVKLIITIKNDKLEKAFEVSLNYRESINEILKKITNNKLMMVYTSYDDNDNIFELSATMEDDIYEELKKYYLCRSCQKINHKDMHYNHICIGRL